MGDLTKIFPSGLQRRGVENIGRTDGFIVLADRANSATQRSLMSDQQYVISVQDFALEAVKFLDPAELVSSDTPNLITVGSDGKLFVQDAPSDGQQYGRKDGAWSVIEPGLTITKYVSDPTSDLEPDIAAAWNDYGDRNAVIRAANEVIYFEWPAGGDTYRYNGDQTAPPWTTVGADWTTLDSGATPGGGQGAVQYNDGGVFTGNETKFFWDPTAEFLGIGTATQIGTERLNVSGNVYVNQRLAAVTDRFEVIPVGDIPVLNMKDAGAVTLIKIDTNPATPGFIHQNADYKFTIGNQGLGVNAQAGAYFYHNSVATPINNFAVLQNSGGATTLNAAAGQNLTFNIGNTNFWRVDPTGNFWSNNSSVKVGIGTATPLARLQIAELLETTELLILGIDDVNPRRHVLGLDLWNGYHSIYDAGNVEMVRTHARGASWFNGGNVGIGIDAPTYLLDIRGSGTPGLQIQNNTAGVPFNIYMEDAGGLQMRTAGTILIGASNSVNFRVNPNGDCQVQGALVVSGAGTVNTKLTISGVEDFFEFQKVTGSSGDVLQMWTKDGHNIHFQAPLADKFYFDKSIETPNVVTCGSVKAATDINVANGLDPAANVGLNFDANSVPRIRYGGSGAGSSNGFQIQRTGDGVVASWDDNGNFTCPGQATINSGARIYATGEAFRIRSNGTTRYTKAFSIADGAGNTVMAVEHGSDTTLWAPTLAMKNTSLVNTVIINGGSGIITASNFQLGSDIRYKNVLETYKGDDIDFIRFNTEESDKTRYGVSAQQVQKIEPDLVEEVDGKLTVKYIDLLVREVARLNARLAKLEG